jgi:DNA-binding XRE family transcriptional regulator
MFDGIESPRAAPFAVMAKKRPIQTAPRKTSEDMNRAERLKRLRETLGYPTQSSFAAFLGISVQRWSNFENGMPISQEIVFLLVRSVPGLSSDWLYFGKSDGLSVSLARRLGELGPPGKRTTA